MIPASGWMCCLPYMTITTQHPGADSKASHLSWQDVVNCVGGMGVLLPLLEQVVTKKEEAEDEQETNDLVGPELTSSRNAQGMLIPLVRSSGEDSEGDVGQEPPCSGGWRLPHSHIDAAYAWLVFTTNKKSLAQNTKIYGVMEKPCCC